LPGFSSSTESHLINMTVGKAGVIASNNVALVSGSMLLAREGSLAPDVSGSSMAGVKFNALSDPVSGDGVVAFESTIDGTGVTASNNHGIWYADDGIHPRLIARTGSTSDAAPGGGHWSKFDMMALPDDPLRGPVFLGTLATSAADGVTASNNMGIWAVDSTGTLRLLLRTGQKSGGLTIKTIQALVPALESVGAGNGYDNAGNIAVLVTFTTGAESLVLITAP
jgi:hypothetical protein